MKLVTLTLAASLIGGVAFAGVVAPKDVAVADDGSVAQSLTGVPGNPENGAAVVGTKKLGNCIACHEVPVLADVPFQGNVGPVLDDVGDRYTEAELRGILVNAKNVFPDTVMPAFYKVDGFNRPAKGFTAKPPEGELPPLLSGQQIEDVIAFLMTLK